MSTVRTLFNVVAIALLVLIASALLLYAWLRYEFERLEPDPRKRQRKLTDFLRRKGFGFEIIRAAITPLLP